MPRLPCLALLVASQLIAAASLAAECTWTDYKKQPAVTPDEGVIFFSHEVPREWWTCARKEGGKATVELLVGDGETMAVKKTSPVSSASLHVGAYRNFLCDNKAKKLQFRVTGTGSMEPISHTSEVIEVDAEMCPRCTYKDWETSVGVMFIKTIELVIGVDPEWFECAKAGSTWEIRFYTGATKAEVKAAKEPAYAHDLMGKPKHIREPIPYAKVCKGEKPAFWGYQVVGTGELARVSQPRVISAARCPQQP